ncbi:uncharacterized protein LOC122513725 [Polistes fuscatus]|uniref:Uncharacterized protein LOC107072670 n=2 Tax=Opisthokonta TaxID=33154 RepID=A0ABM1J749_POLDO|nr:PREDICTED: uncharacterized protein LOC106789330 [Polistes canadensis]XP_015188287.1 PREDICTED: uncharacterized protein LOC107072670 [Polistes dominula]XP_043486117.1 uncharacterized protein LOC122513725 [Polistes fuscatus]
MFKLAVLAAILAVAAAAPGGLTGIAISAGTGPIHAPQVVAAAAPVAAHVVAQPVAPAVLQTPIVTRTVLNHAAYAAPLLHAAPLHG